MNDPPVPFRFSVRMLYWATALIAVVFGFFESPFNAIILGELLITYSLLWAFGASRHQSLSFLLLIALLQIGWFVNFPEGMQLHRTSPQRGLYTSRNNLKMLSLCVFNYQESQRQKTHLASYTVDEDGEKLHSWRTILLPYLENYLLAEKINYDAPWNSTENMSTYVSLEVFQNPAIIDSMAHNSLCSYFAIVGKNTFWPPGRPHETSEMRDNSAETILLIKHLESGIKWYEPRDLTVEEAVYILTNPKSIDSIYIKPGYFRQRYFDPRIDGHHIAFADGHVESIPPIKDPAVARALLTCNGGEDLTKWRESLEKPILEYSWTAILIRCLQLAIFIAVATYPYWQKQPPPTTSPANLSEGE